MEDSTPRKKARPRAKSTTPAKKATPQKAAAPKAPAKKATPQRATPTKAAKKATPVKKTDQPILDEALLSHLDQVLADTQPPVIMVPAETVRRDPTPPSRAVPLWARLVADPGFAPEHVTRDAVRRHGPVAAEWVEQMRRRYPDARPDALARLAANEGIRAARRKGALTVGAAAGDQVRVVLTIAAAYGLDPTSESRVRDVLELMRVPRLTQRTGAALANVGRLATAAALRMAAGRLVPFGSLVAGTFHSGRTTGDIGTRAMARFRPTTPKTSEERDLVV